LKHINLQSIKQDRKLQFHAGKTGNKKGRPPQKVVCVLRSYPVAFPSGDFVIERVVYDTGLQKRGFSILLGGE
jgi:hypothetical protein